jgi:hypothetical protein
MKIKNLERKMTRNKLLGDRRRLINPGPFLKRKLKERKIKETLFLQRRLT